MIIYFVLEILLYLACLKLFPMAGKSDFNENPVVSQDSDLDFELGFVNFFLTNKKSGVVAVLGTQKNCVKFYDIPTMMFCSVYFPLDDIIENCFRDEIPSVFAK